MTQHEEDSDPTILMGAELDAADRALERNPDDPVAIERMETLLKRVRDHYGIKVENDG